MAIVTRVVAEAEDAAIRMEVDYDDGTRRWSALRVVNNSSPPHNVYFEAFQSGDNTSPGRKYGALFGPGTTEIPIAAGPSVRMQWTLDPFGRLGGMNFRVLGSGGG